jgi:hypothetical protein
MHIVYQSLGLAPWAGRRHLGRALAAHGWQRKKTCLIFCLPRATWHRVDDLKSNIQVL